MGLWKRQTGQCGFTKHDETNSKQCSYAWSLKAMSLQYLHIAAVL